MIQKPRQDLMIRSDGFHTVLSDSALTDEHGRRGKADIIPFFDAKMTMLSVRPSFNQEGKKNICPFFLHFSRSLAVLSCYFGKPTSSSFFSRLEASYRVLMMLSLLIGFPDAKLATPLGCCIHGLSQS
ncbi:hypothetical protein Nepgr_003506 [Nepenthes gracilis]|uniref:Uncharacterized protein n=1 Tax=Nepenthes gracilis TaxID=150966 RepID=A0AAD3RZR5_NEPGR|nr:hypothetical protein Nepgr_003506 [Nepenthes gracilis]